jgi:hypothetical protein
MGSPRHFAARIPATVRSRSASGDDDERPSQNPPDMGRLAKPDASGVVLSSDPSQNGRGLLSSYRDPKSGYSEARKH